MRRLRKDWVESLLLIVTKMAKINLKETIVIPDGIEITIDPLSLKASGPNGTLDRKYFYPGLKLTKEGNILSLEYTNASKKEKMVLKTLKAHIENMLMGTKRDFVYSLKICSGHFPMTVTQEGNKIIIKNFLGEKVSRSAKILENVKVEINKDVITLSGFDIEAVGQSAANLEKSTRITNRDRRRFQDGIYITNKAGEKEE